MTLPAPARARRAARAALPRAQDPRRRALPLLTADVRRTPPVDDLARRAVEAAAADAARRRRARAAPRRRSSGPKKAGFGDYSTNAAMLLAPALGAPPREIAERLGAALQRAARRPARARRGRRPGLPQPVPRRRLVRRRARARARAPATASARGGAPSRRADPRRVRLRQPDRAAAPPPAAATPPTATRSRGCSTFAGHEVEREYYVNDAGAQVRRLGESIRARARGEEPPEDGYQGDYVAELADADPRRGRRATPTSSRSAGVELMVERIRATLDALPRATSTAGSSSARCTRASRAPSARARAARASGHAYRVRGRAVAAHDDASATTRTACSCARPASRPTSPSDIAYHEDKRERGFDRLDQRARRRPPRLRRADEGGLRGARRRSRPARGPDHAVRARRRARRARVDVQAPRRLRHARRADRRDRRRRDALLHAPALARHDGRPRPRPRARAVGREPRLLRAVRARADRARCCARRATERVAAALAAAGGGRCALRAGRARADQEAARASRTRSREAAERRAPHRIAAYALELAQDFTAFYRDCRVVGAEPEALESFRLALCVATQRTIARALDLLGVERARSAHVSRRYRRRRRSSGPGRRGASGPRC